MLMRPMAVAALAATVLACGGSGGGGSTPEQAMVRGSLKQSQPFEVAGRVSFALQWMGAMYSDMTVNGANADPYAPDPQFDTQCATTIQWGDCNGTAVSGTEACRTTDVLASVLLQPVLYAASFPIGFAVPIEPSPPGAALYDLAQQGGSGAFAMGTVLAFVDENGDGALRLGTPGVRGERGLANSAYQDYLPPDGVPRRSYFVTYLRGTMNPASVNPAYAEVVLSLPQGYAIWQKDEWLDAAGNRVSVQRSAQPIHTQIELVSRPGIEDSLIWCKQVDSTRTFVTALPDGEVPDSCSADHLSALWRRGGFVAPCTTAETWYQASFSCATSAPPWSSSCP